MKTYISYQKKQKFVLDDRQNILKKLESLLSKKKISIEIKQTINQYKSALNRSLTVLKKTIINSDITLENFRTDLSFFDETLHAYTKLVNSLQELTKHNQGIENLILGRPQENVNHSDEKYTKKEQKKKDFIKIKQEINHHNKLLIESFPKIQTYLKQTKTKDEDVDLYLEKIAHTQQKYSKIYQTPIPDFNKVPDKLILQARNGDILDYDSNKTGHENSLYNLKWRLWKKYVKSGKIKKLGEGICIAKKD